MKSITPDTLLRLRAKMLKCAYTKRHPRPEDIASEYVVRLLEGYHAKATVDQAYIDICRLSSGRKGQPGYDAKRTLQMVASTEAQMDYVETQVCTTEGLTHDELLDLERVCNSIKCARTRKVFNYLMHGYTLAEIAQEIDLTESRVSQIIQREVKNLHRKL